MKKVAVISDVHANLEALEAVLPKVKGYDLWVLGDLVGYGANPNEVVESLRRNRSVTATVTGNHDWAAAHADYSRFNERAAAALMWTTHQLTPENLSYLSHHADGLKVTVDGTVCFLVHGSPRDALWEYVHPSTHSGEFPLWLKDKGAQVVGLGHTHVPFVWKEGRATVFNPGSVGQPRDGDPRASFALLTFDAGRVTAEIIKVPYDIDAAAKKIVSAGMPYQLAKRLYLGA